MFKKKHFIIITFCILLLIFTTYILADTFLITRVYTSAAGTESSAAAGSKQGETNTGNTISSESSDSADAADTSREDSDSSDGTTSSDSSKTTDNGTASAKTVTANSYQDENIRITLSEYQEYDTTIYVADIQVSDPAYLKTALAQGLYGKNVTETTSSMAGSENAILAINGDYYGVQENGYVLKNGVLYRDTAVSGKEDLVIYEDGSWEIITEDEVSAAELLENGAMQILSFGPALIEDGEISVSVGDEVGKAKSSNPRTALGMISECHYVFVVSDGRTDESEGLSLYDLAEFMDSLGVTTAYNLDGGGSSTMYFNGQVINNPTTNGNRVKERKVSDIVYIGY